MAQISGTAAPSTPVVVWGPQSVSSTSDIALLAILSADQTFRLDLQMSDAAGNWYTVKTVASAAANADGGSATLVNTATLEVSLPDSARVVLYNTGASTANYVGCVRVYYRSKS